MNKSLFISGPGQLQEMLLINYLIYKNFKLKNKLRSKRFEKLGENELNVSDWLAKSMMGLGLLKLKEKKNAILENSKKGKEIGLIIDNDNYLKSWADNFFHSLKNNSSKRIGKISEKLLKKLEEKNIIDILVSIDDSVVYRVYEDFFKAFGEIVKEKFEEEIWKFINVENIKNESSTASSAENRVPSSRDFFTFLGFLVEYKGKYSWSPSSETTSFLIVEKKDQKDFSDKVLSKKIKIRLGQTYFRKKLLKRDKCCIICSISNPILLTAAHIKKHSLSEKNEKYDIENGIILCKIHDSLFEEREISFDEKGELLFSSWISHEPQSLMLNLYEKKSTLNFNNKYFKEHKYQFDQKIKIKSLKKK